MSGTNTLTFARLLTTTGAGIKTLTLTGSTAGIGVMGGAIVNNSVSNTTAVIKSGTGTWVLGGANTHTGPTTVSDGTLAINGSLSNVESGATLSGTGTSASLVAGMLSGVSVTPTVAGSNLTLTVTGSVSGKTGSTTITATQTQFKHGTAARPSMPMRTATALKTAWPSCSAHPARPLRLPYPPSARPVAIWC